MVYATTYINTATNCAPAAILLLNAHSTASKRGH